MRIMHSLTSKEHLLQTVNANGITLSYDTQGNPNDEPILLIMGLGMQLIGWKESFCQALVEQGFYVIRFDNRDCGLSTKMEQFGTPNLLLASLKRRLRLPLSSGYKLHDMAQDAIGLLDALCIQKAHIVGASMGGMIAHIMAATYPQRVRSLTSIMSTSGRRGLPGPSKAARKALLSRPKNPNDFDSVIQHFMGVSRTIGSPGFPTAEPVMRERITTSARRSLCPAGTARQMMAVVASNDSVALLQKINLPTLVIHGSDDPLIPIACGRDTAQLVSGAIFREIEGMGHDFAAGLDPIILPLIYAHCRGQTIPQTQPS